MSLMNDAYDAADVMMTEHEKGKKAAEKKKAEIEAKKKKAEQDAQQGLF